MNFIIQHGEKVVAAVFGMIACYALATANWLPTEEIPNSLMSAANENRDSISQNPWPDEERFALNEIRDVLAITTEGGQIVDSADFQIIPFEKDQKAAIEKRTAVYVAKPESPRAVSFVFPLAMPPATDEESPDDDVPAESSDDEKDEDDKPAEKETAEEMLKRRFGKIARGTATSRGGRRGLRGGGLLGRGREEDDRGGASRSQPVPQVQLGGGGMFGRGREEDSRSRDIVQQYGTGLMTDKKRVRVVAGVSVTMIIDLRKQRRLIREALHLEGDFQVAQNEILYVDLVVERMQSDGRSAVWEPVSREDLAELLKDSLGTDLDIVSPEVTRNSITMPLPRRAAGTWQPSEVSHPRVEKFVLSEEEREIFDKANELLAKEFDLKKEAQPELIEVRGFSRYISSTTDVATNSSVFVKAQPDENQGSGKTKRRGRGGNRFAGFSNRVKASFNKVGKVLTERQLALIDTSLATADHRLLLIRFLDGTVERGKAYKYRCRVVMKNPNYLYPLDALEDPSLADESEVLSEWSDPTPAVFVPQGQRTYVAKVTARPGVREKVDVQVYSDTTKTGLAVMGRVKVASGMPIGGRDSLEVVDLTTELLERQDTMISTTETLVGAEELSRRFSASDPELRVILDGLDRTPLSVPDQIAIADGTGDLKLRWTNDALEEKESDERDYKGLLTLYDSWRTDSTGGRSEFFGDDSEGGRGKGKGRRSGMSRAAATGDFYNGSPRASKRGKGNDR